MAEQRMFKLENVTIYHQDAALVYQDWPTPDVIISDGRYGVSGFKGDAREPAELKAWYLGHIQSWSRYSRPGTTLWFGNTRMGNRASSAWRAWLGVCRLQYLEQGYSTYRWQL